MAVVVDLPWVPAIATPSRSCMIWPSISAYLMVLRPYRPAAWNSALVSLTAAVRTTRSISRLSNSPICPRLICAPCLVSSMVWALGLGSEPVTMAPLSRSMRASPFIPLPPMPMK